MFTDKVVWITGASSGIGRALAIAFSSQNAKVIISARNLEKLSETKGLCENTENVKILQLDISEHSNVGAKTSKAISLFGKIDILVNNAGISQRGFAAETDIEIDKKIINTNLIGTIALTKAVLPGMIEKNSGHIVTVTSVLGKFGAPTRSAYSASKHGLHGFFDSLRSEVYKNNILISLICPGYVKTDVSINALGADGTPHNKLDQGQENGISADECARRMLDAVKAQKSEAYIGGKECGGVYLKRFIPSLFEKIIRKVKIN
jgi:short-subunit dehydrogenase